MPRKSTLTVSNRQIVNELREGNRLGYKHLTERYHRRLLHEAVSVYKVEQADAEEIVNDVLLLVVSRILGFEFKRSDGDFRSWVVTILRNRVRDHLRKNASSQYRKASLDDEVIPDYTFIRDNDNEATVSILRGLKGQPPEAENPKSERRDLNQLLEILEAMPVWEQVLLRCRALEIPYEEIAIYTGKSAQTLKVYHSRAQSKLKKEMERRYPNFLPRLRATK